VDRAQGRGRARQHDSVGLFIDLHRGAFDEGFGEEPGHGGAEFIDEAGDDFGFAGEHGAGGEEGDGFGRHVELFGRFEPFSPTWARLGKSVSVAPGQTQVTETGFCSSWCKTAAEGIKYESLGGGVEAETGYGLVGGGAGDIHDIGFGLAAKIRQEEPGQGSPAWTYSGCIMFRCASGIEYFSKGPLRP
jgi:hypothetical protein